MCILRRVHRLFEFVLTFCLFSIMSVFTKVSSEFIVLIFLSFYTKFTFGAGFGVSSVTNRSPLTPGSGEWPCWGETLTGAELERSVLASDWSAGPSLASHWWIVIEQSGSRDESSLGPRSWERPRWGQSSGYIRHPLTQNIWHGLFLARDYQKQKGKTCSMRMRR